MNLPPQTLRSVRRTPAIGLLALFAGCSTILSKDPIDVPDPLRPPPGQVLALEAIANGVQVYQCSPTDRSAPPGWVFKGPEAALADAAGRPLGQHDAGPRWQSTDGSTVVGAVVASDPGPDPQAIPWLLLRAKANTGPGVLAQVVSIQRLRTAGGRVPATPCTPANAEAVVRVPYTALYRFYAPAPAPRPQPPTMRGMSSY